MGIVTALVILGVVVTGAVVAVVIRRKNNTGREGKGS
jgi:hypothetical protein